MEKVCCFNRMVDCAKHECCNCGWNPEVARERIEDWEIKRRMENNKDK